MKLRLYLLIAAVGLVVIAPAAAMIGGQPDGNGHPYVGALDLRPIFGAPIPCSGTLISPTVYLTAGHCTNFFESRGITEARVTFDPVFSDAATFHAGTVHTNPAFTQRQDDPGDMGVIVFATAVEGIAPASLPTEALLDALGPQGLRNETFPFVGYGISNLLGGANGGGPPRLDVFSAGTRKVGVGRFLSLTPGWLRLDVGDARPCVGDSGAPILLGDTDLVVGIGVRGDAACETMGAWVRLDTPSARAFLGQFVTLP